MLYWLVAYFVISYHVPKMARAALLSCDHHGGRRAGIILWLPGETTSETTSFGLVFITNTAIFTQISSRPISNPIKTPCFVPDNRILYWRPTRWSCWEIFFHNQSFLDCRVLQSGIREHGISLENMKDIKKIWNMLSTLGIVKKHHKNCESCPNYKLPGKMSLNVS